MSSKEFWIVFHGFCRRLGGESDREISMVPACVILRLGIRSEDSGPRARARVRALGFGA